LYLVGLRADRIHAGRAVTTAPSRVADRGFYMRHSAGYWHWRYQQRTHQYQQTRRLLRRTWHPTVSYALRLASAVTGVPYTELSAVAWCESRHFPFARNGRYKGLFQLGWSPFGLDPYDPVANALSAALTVAHDGSWRQWECRP
jgi:hypothetical protein